MKNSLLSIFKKSIVILLSLYSLAVTAFLLYLILFATNNKDARESKIAQIENEEKLYLKHQRYEDGDMIADMSLYECAPNEIGVNIPGEDFENFYIINGGLAVNNCYFSIDTVKSYILSNLPMEIEALITEEVIVELIEVHSYAKGDYILLSLHDESTKVVVWDINNNSFVLVQDLKAPVNVMTGQTFESSFSEIYVDLADFITETPGCDCEKEDMPGSAMWGTYFLDYENMKLEKIFDRATN